MLLYSIETTYFICFMFGAVQFLNVFILTLLCVQFIYSTQVTELPPVWERAANSAYHLLFCCLLRYVCPSFPLMFGMGFGVSFGQFLKYLHYFNLKNFLLQTQMTDDLETWYAASDTQVPQRLFE